MTQPMPFTSTAPKREWLLRCYTPDGCERVAVCCVSAEHGSIMIYDTEDEPSISLTGSQIGDFRDALLAAIDQADRDRRELAANGVMVAS